MTETTAGGVIPEFTIGDRLRKARELTGLDQAQFAEEIGISRQSVGNYEVGHTKPKKIVLMAWSMRTGVPVQWLQHGETRVTRAASGRGGYHNVERFYRAGRPIGMDDPVLSPDIPPDKSAEPGLSTHDVASFRREIRDGIPMVRQAANDE